MVPLLKVARGLQNMHVALGLKNLKNLHFRSDLENWYKFLFFRIG